MIYRAKVEGEGLAIIDFDAKGYGVYDDHYNLVRALAHNGKVYVNVDKGTAYIYLVKDKPDTLPDDKDFLVHDFKVVKYEECKDAKELQGFDGTLINRETNTATYLFTHKEIGPSFYLEVDYTYEGEGDNLIVGFLAESEPDSKTNCNGQLLGGCEKYYAKGSYAVGFNPIYSRKLQTPNSPIKDIVLVNPDGNCELLPVHVSEVKGRHTLKVVYDYGSLTVSLDMAGTPPIYLGPNGKPGHIYVVGNSGAAGSRIRINSLILYDGKYLGVKEVQQVGFEEVRIKNFKGISEGSVDLGKVNVIIGANNAGKTSLLEALYLLASAEQRPAGFNDSIELLAYLHGIENNAQKSRSLFHFYNTQLPVEIEGGKRRVKITYENNVIKKVLEGDKEVTEGEQRALFVNSLLLRKYISYIENNWETISNMTDVIKEVISDINEVNNEEYIPTITFEPFAGQNTFYLMRSDGKRVRLFDLGEGLQIFLTVRLLYEYLKPGLILWDDIESHLNPKLLGHIIAWFENIPGQVVITTHNLAVAEDIIENFGARCLAIDVKNDGKLVKKEIDNLSKYLKLNVDPRVIVRGETVG
ncbi:AAA family ATPase [Metallosphaera tengchongensis]|uniref:AAA family ATPase n=1 Tax=Metallosphaera tengchongensis TaxID=1532350 RepID=A0A6N0P0L7_9CREN|nr:ATP-binding protein [Metallosphaera tengchongensis]QKR00820.1 AAA family ATPase [Metallosphaera tengchongensis]